MGNDAQFRSQREIAGGFGTVTPNLIGQLGGMYRVSQKKRPPGTPEITFAIIVLAELNSGCGKSQFHI